VVEVVELVQMDLFLVVAEQELVDLEKVEMHL